MPFDRAVELYAEYNTGVDAVRFCRSAIAAFPAGACGLATLLVGDTLGFGTVIGGRFRAHGHTFLRVGRGLIVDVTADQFGGPPLYVGRVRLPWRYGLVKGTFAGGRFAPRSSR